MDSPNVATQCDCLTHLAYFRSVRRPAAYRYDDLDSGDAGAVGRQIRAARTGGRRRPVHILAGLGHFAFLRGWLAESHSSRFAIPSGSN